MNRSPFITLAFMAVMLQVMTFGACRPRQRVEVLLPTGVVAALESHQHPHAGEHTHDRAADQSHAERHEPGTERSGACQGHPPESPGHVHLWDIGPVAPRPDRDADSASLDAQPHPLWIAPADPGAQERRTRAVPRVPRAHGAASGLHTTRLLI